jgi:ribosome-associated heat shock protein Hsp15
MKTGSKNLNDSDRLSQRLDSWLWVARFFRTRRLSAEAISAGHVKLNDQKTKPARLVRAGDGVTILKQQQEYSITVLGFSDRRLPAPQASNLYEEPNWSVERRENQQRLRKHGTQGVRYDRAKPSQRERKKSRQVKQQVADSS